MSSHDATPHETTPALLARLGTSPAGLDPDEAERRFLRVGPNVLAAHRPRQIVLDFLARFRNPLVLVLLAASAVSAFLGDVKSFVVVTIIVLLSVTLDFVQERRAGRAAERLRRSVALHASVMRGGKAEEIPAARLVPGDVVALSAGDLVPADGRVLEARDFFVNQSFLTGEAYPVEKKANGEAAPGGDPADAPDAVFMGTSVISGSARVVIVSTGRDTALGRIGGALERRPPPTAFERGTHAFGTLILRLTFVLVLFVMLANAVLDRPLLESLLFAVALAVGLTPELLPMVVSVTLSRGALRLAERNVIVKRLSAVQDLGAMDVLCTDKTGTLTEGRIRLERHVDPAGRESDRVLMLACLNSRFETGLRSPLDEAILAHENVDLSGWKKVDEVPFDFERRRVSVLAERDGRRLLVVKGAPEDILRLSTAWETDASGASAPIDDDRRAAIAAVFEDLSREGFRVLGIAWREVPFDHPHAVVTDETALTFAGYVAFLDPPKASAAAALRGLADHGVAIKIVTGDNELVTRHVCRELGIAITEVVTGAEVGRLDDPALAARAETANVFCRVTPAQKARILAALRSRGHVVGFMGDGINDAPSLHAADAGISVDSAVDVAKEAADLILMEQDLGVLLDGVREGRRTFANVLKYIMMGTSSNFGNMGSMAVATIVLPFLPMLPIQILLNNLIYDFSELALPFDHVDEDVLRQPARWDIGFVRRYMLALGPVSSVFDLVTFAVLVLGFSASAELFHTGWFVESLATQVLVIFVIRTRGNPLVSRPHAALVVISLAAVAVAALLPLTPLGATFGFVPPPPGLYAAIGAIAAIYLAVVQVAKRMVYARFDARALPPAGGGNNR